MFGLCFYSLEPCGFNTNLFSNHRELWTFLKNSFTIVTLEGVTKKTLVLKFHEILLEILNRISYSYEIPSE